jgi:23S rRNA (uracil1939-C5)-methyltransferase
MKLEVEVVIEEIGARGDGIVSLDGGRKLFVPFTVPGDRVQVRLGEERPFGYGGRVVAMLARGPGRGEPACRHFGACGGCALQHLDGDHYRRWKLELLETALKRQRVEAGAVRPLVITPPKTRRRADFTAVRRKHGLVLGFNARLSHQLIDLQECPVLVPAIEAFVAPLRALLEALLDPADNAEVIVTETDSGLDLLLVTAAEFGLKRRERIAGFAEEHDLARVARRHPRARGAEVMLERRPVRALFEGSAVVLPPGAFLQASRVGEEALRSAVREAIGDARRIADLFAGCGTFGLPFAAEGRQVLAVEGDRHLAAALDAAARESAGRLRLSVMERDLERRPLGPEELGRSQAAVLDPPRAGAAAQAAALAASEVERIAAVSCNPATFARDARLLVDGGYRLEWIQPVDQFLWSPHLELMAAFRRA